MQKRIIQIIAWLLLGALLLGFVAMAVAAETADKGIYQVGFSKVDINPYYDENDHSKGLMPLPMAGNGFNDRRLGEPNKIDDNGDGKIDDNDGMFATAIAITDQAGQTLLLVYFDMINSGSGYLNQVRNRVCQLYPELRPDRIMFGASHTHSGPSVSKKPAISGRITEEIVELSALYYERLITNLTKACDLAMQDRSPARMYKGSIEANEAECASGPIGDTINLYRPADDQVTVLPGKENRNYNKVRHFLNVIQEAKREVVCNTKKSPYAYYSYPKENGSYIPDPLGEVIRYVGGANFNGGALSEYDHAAKVTYCYADGSPATEEEYNAHKGDTVFWKADVSVVVSNASVSDSDQTMHIVEFRFDDPAKKPIAMVNWRAHTTMNRYVSDDYDELIAQGKYQDLGFYTSYYQFSGDWVNAMRFVLEQNGYRTAFVQGAAGNITGNSSGHATETDRTHARNKGNIYGTEMAEVALELLKSDKMQRINKDGGNIVSIQNGHVTQRKQEPEGLYQAALIYKAEYDPAHPTGTYRYTHTDGLVYKIASIHHANSVIGRYGITSTTAATLNLNAFRIGEEFALITAPNELFDRYSREATLDTLNDYNDWETLNDDKYGEPIVMGYANSGNSYLPSYLSYEYNPSDSKYVSGCYETQTSSYAQGTGEDVIVHFRQMLDTLEKAQSFDPQTQTGYCQACKKNVTWTALDESVELSGYLHHGHYYVPEDNYLLDTKTIFHAHTVCLDLNGKTLLGSVNVFEVDGVLNVQGEGTLAGTGIPFTGGGVLVNEGGTFNLYGGTVTHFPADPANPGFKNGGAISVIGTFNQYGGTVQGAYVTNAGGSIFADTGSRLNFYGGQVLAGKATNIANNIYAKGSVLLTGNAKVGRLHLRPDEIALADQVTIQGEFTGSVNLTLPSAAADNPGMDFGTSVNADFSHATIKLDGSNKYQPFVQGTDLVVGGNTAVLAVGKNGVQGSYLKLQDAVNAHQGTDAVLVLRRKITSGTAVSKDITLDLNGITVAGRLVMYNNPTITCLDYATADYDISDGVCGKLADLAGEGQIVAAPATETRDAYLKVTDDTGISFHAVGLNIHSMGLKPDCVGLYYDNRFNGDSVVKEKVASYGVALSVQGIPTAETMGTTSLYTTFDGSTFGQESATSSLLYGVMDPFNGTTANKNNAAMKVYGRAYIQLDDGSYLFGIPRVRSLQEQVELADAYYFDSYKGSLAGLYQTYKKVMTDWALPNLKAFLQGQ